MISLVLHKKLEKNCFNVLILMTEDLLPSNVLNILGTSGVCAGTCTCDCMHQMKKTGETLVFLSSP